MPLRRVIATSRISPHVSNRAEIWDYRHKGPTDYLLLDTRELKGWTKKHHQDRLAAGQIELLAKDGTLHLFRFVK